MNHCVNVKGLAFDIADLLAIEAWAGENEASMVVHLDHGVDGEEYEEVISLRTSAETCLLLIWRDENTTFVQPLPGRRVSCASVAEALSQLGARFGPTVGRFNASRAAVNIRGE
jgi:hypothetical protein